MYHLYGTHQLVSKLVKESPEKAVDILTRCCADSKVLEEINAYLLQPKPTQREVPALLPSGLDITFGSPASPANKKHLNTDLLLGCEDSGEGIPAPTVLGSHIEHPQPLRPNIAAASPVQDADPNKNAGRIRLSISWDVTTFNVWLDLNAHCDAFYKAFQQQAAKQRKSILDRATITIQLKNDKNMPDEEACPSHLPKMTWKQIGR
ncbi:unnamed protein product [Alternaria alternata]